MLLLRTCDVSSIRHPICPLFFPPSSRDQSRYRKHQQSEKKEKDFFPLLKAIRLPSVFRIDVNQVLHRSFFFPLSHIIQQRNIVFFFSFLNCTYKQSSTSYIHKLFFIQILNEYKLIHFVLLYIQSIGLCAEFGAAVPLRWIWQEQPNVYHHLASKQPLEKKGIYSRLWEMCVCVCSYILFFFFWCYMGWCKDDGLFYMYMTATTTTEHQRKRQFWKIWRSYILF